MQNTGASKGRWLLIALAAISLMAVAFISQAHEAADERLEALDQQLLDHPRDALTYVERGQLNHEKRQWRAALEDFDRAERLDAGLLVLDLLRARTLLACGQPHHALEHADRYITHAPQSADGHLTRARILRVLGLKQAAVSALTAAIDLGNPPSAELFLERADAIATDEPGDVKSAVHSLDEGIDRLGPLASLELVALEHEIGLRLYDDAIARVELLASQATDPAHWLLRKAEILELAGRHDAARTVYEQALEAIRVRPSYAARNRALFEIERTARAAIARIDSDTVASGGPQAGREPKELRHGR